MLLQKQEEDILIISMFHKVFCKNVKNVNKRNKVLHK